MGNIAPMLGAILGVAHTTKEKKSAKKSKAKKTIEPEHVTMASFPEIKKVSEKHMMKENAKHTARRATEDWVEGRISTKEHCAVHDRAKHVMKGKEPREFKGPSGERSFKKMGLK
jgi:hypothetical protein